MTHCNILFNVHLINWPLFASKKNWKRPARSLTFCHQKKRWKNMFFRFWKNFEKVLWLVANFVLFPSWRRKIFPVQKRTIFNLRNLTRSHILNFGSLDARPKKSLEIFDVNIPMQWLVYVDRLDVAGLQQSMHSGKCKWIIFFKLSVQMTWTLRIQITVEPRNSEVQNSGKLRISGQFSNDQILTFWRLSNLQKAGNPEIAE